MVGRGRASNEPFKMNSCIGKVHPRDSVLQSLILISCVLCPLYSPILCVLGTAYGHRKSDGRQRVAFSAEREEPRGNKLGGLRDEECRVADLEGGWVSRSRLSPGAWKL